MSTLCISVGNPLRGDDGVAHRVLDLLNPTIGATFLRTQQLTPEISEIIGRAQKVVIIDADVQPGAPIIEPITWQASHSSLSHSMSPAEVVALAAQLFGFKGAAFLCRVPGYSFDPVQGLSAGAEANAHLAGQLIGNLCTAFGRMSAAG